jgi:ATP-independent RNA helicase DbpA
VLCPTRELCTQVAGEIRKLGRHLAGLRVLIVSGGQPGYPQRRALEEGVHVVVGTPGRVLDHLDRRTLDPRDVRVVVLDEADRMLDMGFQEDVERILAQLPKVRQTVFFSATFPRSIATMSEAWQGDPVHVTITDAPRSPEDGAPPSDVRQVAYTVEPDGKAAALLALFAHHPPEAAIVFCNLKVTAQELAEQLSRAGFSAGSLHGDLDQRDRDRVMAKFRNRSTRILVATDVAARGLDIEDLDLIVNFDLPAQPDIYVHRIGRTGRAGKSGLAVSLATPREGTKLDRISGVTGVPVERLSLDAILPAQSHQPHGHPAAAAVMETLFIGGGRRDKLRPGDILGALTGEAGLSATDIGKIEIHDRFAYVAVAKPIARQAFDWLAEGRIKGRHFRVERVR